MADANKPYRTMLVSHHDESQLDDAVETALNSMAFDGWTFVQAGVVAHSNKSVILIFKQHDMRHDR